MNRVLSIEQSQRCSGQSEYVTKRLCISVVISIGFLCVLGGYLLGRLAADSRNAENANRLFSVVPRRVANLLKKAEHVQRTSRLNSTQLKADFVNHFMCRNPPDNPVVVGELNDYIGDTLALREKELLQCIYTADLYLDSVR